MSNSGLVSDIEIDPCFDVGDLKIGAAVRLFASSGKKTLLEFLRNLTPQILLLSSAMALGVSAMKPEAALPVMRFTLAAGLLLLWFFAFLANFENFLEGAFSDTEFVRAESRRLKLGEQNRLRRMCLLLSSIWRHSKITFIELLLVIVIIYVSMFTVLYAAVGGALKMPH